MADRRVVSIMKVVVVPIKQENTTHLLTAVTLYTCECVYAALKLLYTHAIAANRIQNIQIMNHVSHRAA